MSRLHCRQFSTMFALHGLNLRLQDFDRFIACGDLLSQNSDFLPLPFDFRRSDHRPDTVEDGRADLGGGVFQFLGLQLAFYRSQFGRGSMQFCTCRLFLLCGMFDGFELLLLNAE